MLEIYDAANKLVRRFASDDKPLAVDFKRINPPDYWARPFQPLPNEAGMQRFVWNLQYPNPPADSYDLPISAIYKDTPFVPEGPFVLPGNYTVKLTANGKTYTQKLNVKIDPRVTTSAAGLQQQFTLSMQAYEGIKQTAEMIEEANKLLEKAKASNDKNLENDLNPIFKRQRRKRARSGFRIRFESSERRIFDDARIVARCRCRAEFASRCRRERFADRFTKYRSKIGKRSKPKQ